MASLAMLTARTAVPAGRAPQSSSKPSAHPVRFTQPARRLTCRAAEPTEVTGIVFQPFTEVESTLAEVATAQTEKSFARVDFAAECEAAINEQINIEYNISYVYHAMYAYFDRDNVALPGFAAYFKAGSVEEREHAEILMEYQNLRGGHVKLQTISLPEMEFGGDGTDKGDALYAMELALSLEKLNFQKLRALHDIADQCGDAQMCDFIEGDLLQEQVEAVKKTAEYVSQLRRIGKGLGVYLFDKEIGEAAAAQPAA